MERADPSDLAQAEHTIDLLIETFRTKHALFDTLPHRAVEQKQMDYGDAELF